MQTSQTLQRLCVYCGSRPGNRPSYIEAAKQLGRLMGQRHIALTFGGSYTGLMGALADAVLEAGGEVLGVFPEKIIGERLHPGLTQTIITHSMPERKRLLMENADALVALPGAWGTLDEISEALAMNQLHLIKKPCAFLNTEGFYDRLFAFMDRAVQDGLLLEKNRSLALCAENPETLLNLIERELSKSR